MSHNRDCVRGVTEYGEHPIEDLQFTEPQWGPSSSGDSISPLRILIVDDKPRVRSGIRMLLQKHQDWTICGEASDGVEAIQKADELKPDVILLDISMPKMDGLTALPLIRKKSPESRIIVLTLHESVDVARVASGVGARAYITKSLISELLPVLEALQPDEAGG